MEYKILGFVVCLTVIVSCSGGGGSDSADSDDKNGDEPKSLFSEWHKPEGDLLSGLGPIYLDLAEDFGDEIVQEVISPSPDYYYCLCKFSVDGSESVGTYTLSGCIYGATVDGSIDLNVCPALDETGIYSKMDSVLTIHRQGGALELFE